MRNKILLLIGICIIIYLLLTMYNSNTQRIDGLYVGENFTKNIDSIEIMTDGTYKRVVYNNKGKLIFRNNSTYKKYNSYIRFNDFLLNSNDLAVKDNLSYNSDDLVNASLKLNVDLLGGVKLFVDYDLNYYYLRIR